MRCFSLDRTCRSYQPLCLILIIITLAACSRSLPSQYVQTIPNTEFNRALNMVENNEVDAGIRYVDSLKTVYAPLNVANKWRIAFFDARVAWLLDDMENILALTDSMQAIAEHPDHLPYMQAQLAESMLIKGDVYSVKLNRNDKAYTNYVRARIIGIQLDDVCLISAYDARFALVLYRRQDYLEAANYFKKSLENYENCDGNTVNFFSTQRRTDDIAISYAKVGMYDSAMVYHQKALDYIDNRSPELDLNPDYVEMAKGVIYGNMGQSMIALGRTEEAEDLLRKNIEINTRRDLDLNDAHLTRLHLSKLLLSQNRLTEVESLLSAVENDLDSLRNPVTTSRWYDAKSIFLEKTGNYRDALAFRQQFNQLDDSLKAANMSIFDADASNEYNRILAQQELERLRADNRIRSIWLISIAIVVSLLAVVVVLIFFAWHQSRRNNAILATLNAQINSQKETLESTVEQLKVKSVEKDKIMWMVAHDLRNPLGAITSLAEILKDEIDEDSRYDSVDQIRFASTSAIKFIEDILTAANGSQHKLDLKPTDIDILISRTIDLMRFRAHNKGQTIEWISSGKECMSMVDPESIIRAVINLIGNAIKFSAEGAIIRVHLNCETDNINIQVVDEGIGIPVEFKDTVFDPFTTAKRPGTRGEKPFGLGLSIASSIAREHGGRLWYEPNGKKGTRFILELPTQSA